MLEPLEGRPAEIAAAAYELIAENGFEGLRTRDIAARVGINIATLHYHVPTKEALIGLVAQTMRNAFVAQHVSRPREGLSPRELLRLEFVDFQETMVSNPRLFAVMTELTERARRDPKVHAIMQPMKRYWHDAVVSILSAGRANGDFRADLDPQAGALMVIGTLIATQRHPSRDLELFHRACEELMRCFTTTSHQDTPKV